MARQMLYALCVCACMHVCIHICVCVLVHLYSSVHVELTDKGDGRELKLGLSGSDMLTHMALTLSLSHSGRGLASAKKKRYHRGNLSSNFLALTI